MAALVVLLACSKCSCRQWRVAQNEQRKKKRKKGRAGERRVSSPSPPVPSTSFFFFLLGFLCTVPTICTPGIRGFSGASRLGCGRKKERHQSYQCLKVTRDQAFIFFLLGGGGVKGRKIFINCYAIGYV